MTSSLFRSIKLLITFILLFILESEVKGQLIPAPTIGITKVQDISFGFFTQRGTEGTISVSSLGLRTATGGVIPLNLGGSVQSAAFNVSAPLGTIITLLLPSDVKLSGSAGGEISLRVHDTLPISPFVTTQTSGNTQVKIGGTLTIKSLQQNPPGNYSGTFTVILVNQ
jgi:hypothetical protein